MIVDGEVYVPCDRIDELIDRRKANETSSEEKAPETELPKDDDTGEQNV